MVDKMGKIHLFVDILVEFQYEGDCQGRYIFYFVHFLWVVSLIFV
jgi:hypothetical protein